MPQVTRLSTIEKQLEEFIGGGSTVETNFEKKKKSSDIEGRIANIEKMMKLSDMANTKKRVEEKERQAEPDQVRGTV